MLKSLGQTVCLFSLTRIREWLIPDIRFMTSAAKLRSAAREHSTRYYVITVQSSISSRLSSTVSAHDLGGEEGLATRDYLQGAMP